MSKITYGLMLTCNEYQFLQYSIQGILPHVDKLLIFDVSTDATRDYLEKFPQVVVYKEEDYPELISLSAKRQFLLDVGRAEGATHYLCIDADEIMSLPLAGTLDDIMDKLEVGQACAVPWYHMVGHDTYVVGMYSSQRIMFRDDPSLSYDKLGHDHTHEYRSAAPEDGNTDGCLLLGEFPPLLHYGRDDLDYLEWKNTRSMIGEYIDGQPLERINFNYITQESVTLNNTVHILENSIIPKQADDGILKIRRSPILIQQSILRYVKERNVPLYIIYKLDLFRTPEIYQFLASNLEGFDASKVKWKYTPDTVGKLYSRQHYYELLISLVTTMILDDPINMMACAWKYCKRRTMFQLYMKLRKYRFARYAAKVFKKYIIGDL